MKAETQAAIATLVEIGDDPQNKKVREAINTLLTAHFSALEDMAAWARLRMAETVALSDGGTADAPKK